jgi:predicted RecB family nuclease
MATKITSDVLEGYLRCKSKGHLKLAGQQGTKSDFEAMLTGLRAEVRLKAIDAIIARHRGDQVARNVPLTTANLKRGPQYILDGTLEDDALALHFDGLKRVEGESKLGDFHYLPVLFHEGRQVKKEQRLLLEVYGMVLSSIQGRVPTYGVVWHGRQCKGTRVRLNPDHRKAEQVLRALMGLASSGSPPRLLLNDHCPMCEFRHRCREQAVREDNITLLQGMGEKEVNRYARKGISTVTQLSCTFRLRKRGKRVKTQQRPRYFALQALALREKKIYVLGTPVLPTAPVRMYFDCEGDPERGFVYLIGLTVVGAGRRGTTPSGRTTRRRKGPSSSSSSTRWPGTPAPPSSIMAVTNGHSSGGCGKLLWGRSWWTMCWQTHATSSRSSTPASTSRPTPTG